jgi:aspartate/methionine/tyrosine aminotransferase
VERFGMDGDEFSRQLCEKGVIGVPGRLFGENGVNSIRFTFTKPEHELKQASDIINEFVEGLN